MLRTGLLQAIIQKSTRSSLRRHRRHGHVELCSHALR